MEIPDSVQEIGYRAFYRCVSLEDIQLPAALKVLPESAFEGAVVRNVGIGSEDSPAALTLIDLEIPYTAEETGIRDSGDRFLDRTRTDYYASTSAVSAAGQIPLTAKYAFKSAAAGDVSNLRFTIEIPQSSELTLNTLKVNGVPVDYQEDNGRITFSAGDLSGTITFSVKPESASYLMSYLKVTYSYRGSDRTEVLGIVNMAEDVLTLFVPSESSSDRIVAAGVTTPGQEVSVYLGGEKKQTVTASATGNYSATLLLPSPSDGKTYLVEARIEAGGKTVSASGYVTFRPNAANMTVFDMYYRGNRYDLINMNSKSPVISWNGGASFTFVVDFDDCSKVDLVRIVSVKGTEEKYLDAVYDETEDRFVASGFTGYVPGTVYVQYAEEGEDLYAGASTRIVSADHDGTASAQRVFYVDQGEDGPGFYYLTEYEADAVFDYSARKYVQGSYRGKTCYMTEEPYRYEKDGGCFYVQEVYVAQSDGSYTMFRNGIGLYDEEAAAGLQADGLQDLWEKTENLYEIMSDKDRQSDESEIYRALYEYIDAAKREFPEKATELNMLEYELQTNEIISNGCNAINKSHKTAKHAIRAADDPAYLMPDTIEGAMDDCFDSMEDLARKVKNKGLQKVLKEMTDKGFFNKDESLLEELTRKTNEKYKESNAKFRGRYSIDPSGYVYEGVEENRISGVKATIYYRETMSSKEELWDAGEYDQINPVFTDVEGCYAWDVPEGYWQVKYEKDGYETAYSDWLPVPPPQVDVNVGMRAAQAPTAALVSAHSRSIDVVFTQYMDVSTVNSDTVRFLADGQPLAGSWQAEDQRTAPGEPAVTLARTFRFLPDTAVTCSEVQCRISGAVSYTGQQVQDYQDTVLVDLELSSVQTESQVSIPFGGSGTIVIQAAPAAAAAGKTVLLSGGDDYLFTCDRSAVFDSAGTARVQVRGLLPGSADLTYQIQNTTRAGTLRIAVVFGESQAEPAGYSVSGTLEGSQVSYVVNGPAGEVTVAAALYDASGKLLEVKTAPCILSGTAAKSDSLRFSAAPGSEDVFRLFLLRTSDGSPLCAACPEG